MNNTEYVKLSENTERKFPNGLRVTQEMYDSIMALLNDAVECDFEYDGLKKDLIYKEQLISDDQLENSVVLSQGKIELLHAVLGLYTEVTEIITAILPMLEGGKLDEVNLLEEVGDLAWYEAMLFRQLNSSREAVQSANIEKLQTRYPDKFTMADATIRDLSEERKILESGL